MLPPFLQRCIDLARLGGSAAAPNPKVGSVIVHEGKIIGEGYHEQYGGPHAEVNAVRSVQDKSLLPYSTIYVSLEPCNFYGNTPPCADLILEHKIPKVVIGSIDPHPKVAGKSVEKLRAHGVEVEVYHDSAPFHELNKIFRLNQQEKRPYIILKWAESQDGYIAGRDDAGNPVRTAITGDLSAKLIHRLRAACAAIMVGRNTAAIDNPSLTTRHFPGPDPVRIVFDRNLTLSRELKLFDKEGKVIVLNEVKNGEEGNIRFANVKALGLKAILEMLYEEYKIGSLLVEGGTHLLQQFLDAGLFEEVYRSVGAVRLTQGVKAPLLPVDIQFEDLQKLGNDRIGHYKKNPLSKEG